MSFAKYLSPPDEVTLKIPISLFIGFLGEYIEGEFTDDEVKEFIEESLTFKKGSAFTLSAGEAANIDGIITEIDACSSDAEKHSVLSKYRNIIYIATAYSVTKYGVLADLETRLGW